VTQRMRAVTTEFVDGGELEPAQVLALYASVGWTAYTDQPERLAEAVQGSSAVAVARAGDELVGLARVVSDGATICYLQDVLVHPDHQRSGIGRRLAGMLFDRFSHVRQKVLLTDDEPGQKAFYESLGFASVNEVLDGTVRAFVRFDTATGHPGGGGS
jgi:ribosomal protein S18 acetylase RimI-like enzyme